MIEFLLAMIGGALIIGPIYLLFFGGLEHLLRRDEGGSIPSNSFRAGNQRTSDSEK